MPPPSTSQSPPPPAGRPRPSVGVAAALAGAPKRRRSRSAGLCSSGPGVKALPKASSGQGTLPSERCGGDPHEIAGGLVAGVVQAVAAGGSEARVRAAREDLGLCCGLARELRCRRECGRRLHGVGAGCTVWATGAAAPRRKALLAPAADTGCVLLKAWAKPAWLALLRAARASAGWLAQLRRAAASITGKKRRGACAAAQGGREVPS